MTKKSQPQREAKWRWAGKKAGKKDGGWSQSRFNESRVSEANENRRRMGSLQNWKEENLVLAKKINMKISWCENDFGEFLESTREDME